MPELPEVETVARDLARLVGGSMIRGGRIIRAANLSTPDPETFARAIADRRIEGVRRRAKWVLIDLEGGLILMVHLRMTGQLIVLPESSAPDAYVRAELLLSDRRVIRFRDVRAFGRLALVARRGDGSPSRSMDPLDEPALSGHGPEPLEATFTVSRFASDLQRRRGRLKSLLLDQRFIAGLGNIYADEALWRARLHPLATAATLRVAEVERLAVYQRGGEPCLRCGSTIRRVMLGGRGTHFCPRCQPMPRGRRAAGSSGSLTPTASPRRGPRWSEALSEGSAGATSAERAAARRRAVRTGGVQ